MAAASDHGHVPVLLDRCVELLKPALTRRSPDGSGAVLVDATLGAGGHAERFLTELPGLRLIGLDRDPRRAVDRRRAPRPVRRPRPAGPYQVRRDRGVLAESNYWTSESGHPQVDGILFDLGVSSMQLDRTERGFSYAADAPLDMRMDPDAELTAAEVVNTYDERSLARILREFGEERFAGRIAARIVRRRARRAVRPHRRARGAAVRGDPGACPPHRRASRPSARSRRCASPSTASWTRCATRCPPR